MSKKFIAKLTKVKMNFSNLVDSMDPIKDDVEELTNLCDQEDGQFSKKIGTKLRNLKKDLAEVSTVVEDSKNESEEVEGTVAENFSKTRKRSKLMAKCFASIAKNFDDLNKEVAISEAIAEKDSEEGSEVAQAGDANVPPATEAFDDTTKEESEIAKEEVKSFSKVRVLRGKVSRMIKLFAEMEESVDVVNDLIPEVEESVPAEDSEKEFAEDNVPEAKEEEKPAEEKSEEDPDKDLSDASEKVAEIADNIDKLTEDQVESTALNFAKRLVAKARRIKVKSFSDIEEQVEILNQAQDSVEDGKKDVAPTEEKSEEAPAEVEVDDATASQIENLCQKLADADEEKVGIAAKNFAKRMFVKLSKMPCKNFAEATEKLNALEDAVDMIDQDQEEAKDDKVNEVAESDDDSKVLTKEQIESNIDELDKKFSEIDEDKVDAKNFSFAKRLMIKARNKKVVSFADAEEKLGIMMDAVDALGEPADDASKVEDKAEAKDEVTQSDLESIETKIGDISDNISKLETEVSPDLAQFSKMVREYASKNKCVNMSDAECKMKTLKDCAEALMNCIKSAKDAVAPVKNFADEENKDESKEEVETPENKPEESKDEQPTDESVEAPETTEVPEEGKVGEGDESAEATEEQSTEESESTETEKSDSTEEESSEEAESSEENPEDEDPKDEKEEVTDKDVVVSNFSNKGTSSESEYDKWIQRQSRR